VDDLRCARIARVHRVQAQPRPHGCEAAEGLVTPEAIAAVDALGLRRGQEERQIIAGFAVAGGKDLARGRFGEDPLERLVAGPPHVGGEPGPIEVHVRGERRGRCAVGQTPLFAADPGQGHAGATEMLRHRHLEIARGAQLLEIFGEESVVAIVRRRSATATADQFVGKGGHGRCVHRSLHGCQ